MKESGEEGGEECRVRGDSSVLVLLYLMVGGTVCTLVQICAPMLGHLCVFQEAAGEDTW